MNKILFIALFLAVISSSVFVFLYRKEKLNKLNGCMELDWGAIQVKNINSAKKIVFLGDSRISQWRKPQIDPSFNIVNFGVAGATSNELRCAFERIHLREAADWYVINIGINDLVGASMLKDSERIFAEDAIVENIEYVVDRIVDFGGQVVVFTIAQPYDLGITRRLLWGSEIKSKSELISLAITQRLEGKAGILDINSILLRGDKNVTDLYFKDSLHWTDDAYLLISQELDKMIMSN